MKQAGFAFGITLAFVWALSQGGTASGFDPYPEQGAGGLEDYFSLFDLYPGDWFNSAFRDQEAEWVLCTDGANNWSGWNGFSWIDVLDAINQWDAGLHPDIHMHWQFGFGDCDDPARYDNGRNIAVHSFATSEVDIRCGGTPHGCFRRDLTDTPFCTSTYHTESYLPERCQRWFGYLVYNIDKIGNHPLSEPCVPPHTFDEKKQIATHEMGHALGLDDHFDCPSTTVMRWVCSSPQTSPTVYDLLSILQYLHWHPF